MQFHPQRHSYCIYLLPIWLGDAFSLTEMSKENNIKLKKTKRAKSDVGKLLRSISTLRPLEELTVSTDRMKSVVTRSFAIELEDSDIDDSDSLTRSSFLRPRSRIGSAGDGDMRSLSGSLYSQQDSLATDFSQGSRLTQRELLVQIEKRAKHNKPPPDYIQPIDELDPSLISWNCKRPRGSFHIVEPQVNIIGCMHPVELILAKADQRSRKREKAIKQKQEKCEERVKEIDAAIQWKFTRAERYAAILELKQKQVMWLRSVLITNYMIKLKQRFLVSLERQKEFHKVAKYAKVVVNAFYRWYRKHMWRKVHYNYAHAFDKVEGIFRFYLRIYFKRRAVRRLKQFFLDYKGHHKMNIVVHKYLHAVRKVQRSMKDFLACKEAKIIALNKLWEKYEMQYIKKKLELKRRKTQELQVAKRSSDKKLTEMENKAFIEMKQQAQLWARIDSKVENMVNQLKTAGVLIEEDEAEVIHKLMLPLEVRNRAITWIIERAVISYSVF